VRGATESPRRAGHEVVRPLVPPTRVAVVIGPGRTLRPRVLTDASVDGFRPRILWRSWSDGTSRGQRSPESGRQGLSRECLRAGPHPSTRTLRDTGSPVQQCQLPRPIAVSRLRQVGLPIRAGGGPYQVEQEPRRLDTTDHPTLLAPFLRCLDGEPTPKADLVVAGRRLARGLILRGRSVILAGDGRGRCLGPETADGRRGRCLGSLDCDEGSPPGLSALERRNKAVATTSARRGTDRLGALPQLVQAAEILGNGSRSRKLSLVSLHRLIG
jgi:hypothetical protein